MCFFLALGLDPDDPLFFCPVSAMVDVFLLFASHLYLGDGGGRLLCDQTMAVVMSLQHIQPYLSDGWGGGERREIV